MEDLTALPDNLPRPIDDGGADHLEGLDLPAVDLTGHEGTTYRLGEVPSRWLVVYVYPRTGGPGVDLPNDWELIPGARGCTAQSCAFRDHHLELARFGATVRGLSSQPRAEQRVFAERMHMPFPLLNDSALRLAATPLRLPTFVAGGITLYRRLTLVAERGRIRKVFYPVFPPDQNAGDVIRYLAAL